MPPLKTTIEANLAKIRHRIGQACARAGRDKDSVQLIAITKAVTAEHAQILLDLGVTDLGENRIDVAAEKIETLGHGCANWHMIGNLQRRKAGKAVDLFDTIDAVDRMQLAETLQRHCDTQDKSLRVLIETNISGEAAKHGFSPDELDAAIHEMRHLDRLEVAGLLTMAPKDAPEDVIRRVFRGLNERAEALGLPERSMGMTNDFEIAIEEGATQVRIGRALYI